MRSDLEYLVRPPCRNGYEDLGRGQTDWQWKVMVPLAPLFRQLSGGPWGRDDGE
ncbi:MAG: hypothetical protein M1438_01130 [Deltaproteobacteria bacterium]|nr:hypothetical protein [Deltaproteobacteria bacterium]